jgi:hypothetical protein
MHIITSHDHPPIEDRSKDWSAWFDELGEDASPIGRGATQLEAIADLVANYEVA